jgi:hypothetical protein
MHVLFRIYAKLVIKPSSDTYYTGYFMLVLLLVSVS